MIRLPTEGDPVRAAAGQRGVKPAAPPPARLRDNAEFPRRFGQYLLLKPLARGGMGALYLALSGPDESAKLCVIKTVLPHLADKEYLQRFRDEAKVVVRLSHGNLVPVFDSGQVAGEIYLAMDFVEGKDLRATWNRCAKKGIAFPVDVAAHIVRELARGLHYAHGFGDIKLVHRDVSPPNVLLSYSGEVKLTDFGLASSTLKMEKTAPGIIYGKVSYMSPEQARGEPLDGRTDLYASGIILWELLTGRQLFPSGKPAGAPKDLHTSEELLRRVRQPEVVPPSKRAARVPPELDRIALKALAPELSGRYANCEDLRHDLATFLAQSSPATDASRVQKFLSDLYGEDIAAESAERDALIVKAREWYSSKSEVKPPPSRPTLGPPPLPRTTLTAEPSGSRSTPPPPPAVSAARRTTPTDAITDDHELEMEMDMDVEAARDRRATVAEGAGARSASISLTESQNAGTTVVGTVVGGRYYVRRLCGEGGMGRVYEAEHIDIGKRVALKILHPAYSQTPDLVERLRREARAASKISHPNVVDVTDSGTTPEGAFFFVMEYLEGIELGELIYREKRLSVRRTLMIGSQICRALQAAHEVNVIHRDLKPENVLILRRDGQADFVKVLDFGIAKSGNDADADVGADGKMRRLTHPGMTMGTPEYMAPEQAAGRPADPRSDVYAVGGLLYEMLSGKTPFEGENFMEILHKKATTMPAPLSAVRNDVPPQLEAIIMRAMAREPDERPRSMEDLDRELQNLAVILFSNFGVAPTEEPVLPPLSMLGVLRNAAKPSELVARAKSWDRTKVVAVAGAAFGLLVAFVIVGLTGGKHHASGGNVAAASAPAPAPTAPPVAAAPAAPPVPAVPVAAAAPARATSPATPTATVAPTAADDEEQPADDTTAADDTKDGDGRRAADGDTPKARPAKASVASPAESRRMLADGERLLRAERFTEARDVFQKVAKSKRDRGPALVGLAEISFQEKNYAQAARSAAQAAERGGGVKARVLLGDAHFRLAHYKEAARAYQEALKLDPGNASAKSGLALATKRM
jgi:serine/threonine protein kinase